MIGFFRKYRVSYPCGKERYKGAKDGYRAGARVRFRFDEIGTDTDYSFYADGKKLSPVYRGGRGYLIRFRMPDHDIEFRHTASSSMFSIENE